MMFLIAESKEDIPKADVSLESLCEQGDYHRVGNTPNITNPPVSRSAQTWDALSVSQPYILRNSNLSEASQSESVETDVSNCSSLLGQLDPTSSETVPEETSANSTMTGKDEMVSGRRTLAARGPGNLLRPRVRRAWTE